MRLGRGPFLRNVFRRGLRLWPVREWLACFGEAFGGRFG